MTKQIQMNWKSKKVYNKDGKWSLHCWEHEIAISNSLDELQDSSDNYKNISIELIEEMIEEGYNMDFMYYDFNYEKMTRDNVD
jgi:hypothetical protein